MPTSEHDYSNPGVTIESVGRDGSKHHAAKDLELGSVVTLVARVTMLTDCTGTNSLTVPIVVESGPGTAHGRALREGA